jgi:Na+-driven multidrug efflux pump
MLRQVIILIPCILIFSRIWGLYGVVWATPVADAVALIITATLAVREMKKLRHMAKESAEHPATQN